MFSPTWWKTLDSSSPPFHFLELLISYVGQYAQLYNLLYLNIIALDKRRQPGCLSSWHIMNLLVIQRSLCHKRFSHYKEPLVVERKSPKSVFSPRQNHIFMVLEHFRSCSLFFFFPFSVDSMFLILYSLLFP